MYLNNLLSLATRDKAFHLQFRYLFAQSVSWLASLPCLICLWHVSWRSHSSSLPFSLCGQVISAVSFWLSVSILPFPYFFRLVRYLRIPFTVFTPSFCQTIFLSPDDSSSFLRKLSSIHFCRRGYILHYNSSIFFVVSKEILLLLSTGVLNDNDFFLFQWDF